MLLALGVVLVLLAACTPKETVKPPQQRSSSTGTPVPDAKGPVASPECDAPGRERVTRYDGTWLGRINDPYPPSDLNYDLRGLRHVGYGSSTRYAITLANPGSSWTSARACVLGGTVLSSVDRGRTWEDLERNYNGDALDIGVEADWAVVDGLRADNVFDAIAVQGPAEAELVVRNVHLTDIRDDCIENDHNPKSLTIQSSLLDGCFTGISERPDERQHPQPMAAPGAVTILDGVLLRVKAQPFGTACHHAAACADGKGANGLFKWSPAGTPSVRIRDSILRVDRYSAYGPSEMLFPPGTVVENSVLVWLGPGAYPASLPPGLGVTTDVTVWDRARSAWLCRHRRGPC
jgi:hypothetical protein